MVLIAPTMRMGHSEGHTDVCFDETGKIILTCGSDGDVRVWQGLDDDDPQSIDVGESSAALALHKGRLFIASDTNTVQAYTFPEGQSDGIITRFTAPVSHISLSEDGQKLVAGACDFHIKVINQTDSSQKVFEGHTAPILSVAMDPQQQYVASSSCDGTFKIWNLSEENWEKSAVVIPKCSDVSLSKTLCRMSWKPRNGELLAVPLEKKIEVYERDSWDVAYSLEPSGVEGFVSVVSWSPCGNFLASANTDGTLCFWDMKTKKCIEQTKHKKGLSICGLAWNPKVKQEIAFTDIMGQVGVFEGVIPSGAGTGSAISQAQQAAVDLVADLFDDAADEDLLAAVTQAEKDNRKDELDALIDDDDDDDPIHAEIRKAKQRFAMLTGEGQSMDDGSTFGDTASVVSESVTDIVPPVLSAPVSTPVTPMQKPFIPSSTPVHLSSRFMKWNAVGIVRCYDTDDESSIDVEFHDTAVHHALHFDNQHNYTMADLSGDAVLLASESNLEDQSMLMCYHFSAWDNQKDWTTSMPKGENIKCVAIGGGWVAVATDKRLVRLYSTSGIQREVFSLPGPIVCLAAHGRHLLVTYHEGVGVPGDQCLGVKLLDVLKKKSCVVLEGRLPLGPKTTLSWLGFTAEGTAASVDSDGVVRLHNRGLQSWTPVVHTKTHSKGRSDNFWIVGLHENQQQLRCILCKGATFPPTLPRPTITILPLQLPLCELTTEKGLMEESFWRSNLLAQHFSQAEEVDEMAKSRVEREQQDNLMKLFALACRSDRELRALDLCSLMTSHQSVSLAIKYASRSRRMALAQRLSELASKLLQAEEEEEEEEEEEIQYTRRIEASDRRGNMPASRMANGYHSRQTNAQDDDDEDDDDAAGDHQGEDDVDIEMENEEEEEEQPTEPVPTLKSTNKPAKIPSLLPSSQGKRNPFKKQTEKTSTAAPRGTSVFDEIKKKSPETKSLFGKNAKELGKKQPSATQKKMKTQSSLFAPKPKVTQASSGKKDNTSSEGVTAKKAPSAFNYWLSQNRDSLSEENPELGVSDVVKLAMQTWKSLSEDDKKEWGEKAVQSVSESDGKEDEPSKNKQAEKKRKRPDDEETEEKQSVDEKRSKSGRPKKVLNDTTKQPLTVKTNTKLASFAFNKD